MSNINKLKELYAIVFTCILMIFSQNTFSQYSTVSYEKEENIDNDQVYNIYATDYLKAKKDLKNFLSEKKYPIISQKETKTNQIYNFLVSLEELPIIDSLANNLGFVRSKDLSSTNIDISLNEKQLELNYKLSKKNEYEKMQNKLDSVGSDKYYNHWQKIRDIDEEIYESRKYIQKLENQKKYIKIQIFLWDDQLQTTDDNKINFVHMPGIEYSFLFVENPRLGKSYSVYNGYSLKYLFTKGKSYFSLGALKAYQPNQSDSTSYSELFNFTFGQDFYSRYFGRGNYKFCNAYIGYQIGAALAYNSRFATTIPFVSPSFGIELYKGKYFLIDTKIQYFLPITDANQYLRGWQASGAFNIVF